MLTLTNGAADSLTRLPLRAEDRSLVRTGNTDGSFTLSRKRSSQKSGNCISSSAALALQLAS